MIVFETLEILSQTSAQVSEGTDWRYLGGLPSSLHATLISEPIAINDDQYLLVSNMNPHMNDMNQKPGVWLYSISDGCWRYFIKQNKSIVGNLFQGTEKPMIAYNQNNYKLFVFLDWLDKNLLTINLMNPENQQINKINIPSMLCVNEYLHMIGNPKFSPDKWFCVHHVVINCNNVNEKEVKELDMNVGNLDYSGFVYLKKLKEMN